MITEEQRLIRKKGIGGSDAAAALGMSKYKTRAGLWLEKTSETDDDDVADSDAAHFGTILEDIVAFEFRRRTGIEIRRKNDTIFHPEHKFMFCHVDRRVTGEPRGLECKTINAYDGRTLEEPTEDHWIQCQHMMACTGWEAFYIAYLVGGNGFKWFEIPREDEFIADMIEQERDFWGYVERMEMPPMDHSHRSTGRLLEKLYPGTNGETIDLPEILLSFSDTAVEMARLSTQYADAADVAKRHIRSAMGEAAIGRLPDGSMWTRKVTQRKGYTVEPTTYIDFRFKKAKE